jgi:hypothetical protein
MAAKYMSAASPQIIVFGPDASKLGHSPLTWRDIEDPRPRDTQLQLWGRDSSCTHPRASTKSRHTSR